MSKQTYLKGIYCFKYKKASNVIYIYIYIYYVTRLYNILINFIKLVREKGLEPPRRKAPDPKSGASANSATPASQLK